MANQRLRSILFVCALLLLFYLGLPSESPATLHQREQISGPVNSFRTHDATFAERATPAEQAAEAAENTEEKWQASVERGKNFMCLLNMKIEEADEMMKDKSQSSLTDHSDFKGSGWTSSVVSKRLSEVSAISADALKEMGYQPQAPVSYVTWNQNDDYSIAGEAESYPATKGSFLNYYDPSNGVVLYANGHSPANMIKEDNKDQPPPALHSWSDMVFLTMATLAGPNGEKMWTSEVGSLKSVVMLDIKNAATKVRIQQALKKKGPPTYNPSNPPTYDFEAPHTFQWNSNGIDVECFNALLGTPLVSGVAWLLIQHKAQLGVKRISGITPFYAEFSLSRRGNGAIGYDGVARGKSRTLLLIISQTSTTLAVIIVRTP